MRKFQEAVDQMFKKNLDHVEGLPADAKQGLINLCLTMYTAGVKNAMEACREATQIELMLDVVESIAKADKDIKESRNEHAQH